MNYSKNKSVLYDALSSNNFRKSIKKIIDDYKSTKRCNQIDLAQKCRLHSCSITRLKRGENITKQILMIMFLVTKTSLEEAEPIFDLAGCALGNSNNTDIAYRYFLKNNYNLDDAEEEIEKVNEYLLIKYKNISENDLVKNLHRKDVK